MDVAAGAFFFVYFLKDDGMIYSTSAVYALISFCIKNDKRGSETIKFY